MLENKSYHCLNIALQANYEALKRLKEKYLSWHQAWEKEQSSYPFFNLEKEWAKLETLGIRLILQEENEYPFLLKQISWAPFGIYLKGSLPKSPAVGIVGTRKATQNGNVIAKKLAYELCGQKITVVSGLALGIDQSAHQGAVEAGGQTIAVLPTGLDKIYPSQNANLAKNILNFQGALISEYPPGLPSYPSNFVHRNRIISGLSLATVIIEAPEKSGALITASFAVEQNREVLAVPGPANHENYVGSHKLIRDGAKLITSAQEVLSEINIEFQSPAITQNPLPNLGQEEQLVLETIRKTGWPASVDKISELSHIEVSKINQIITYFIIKGILKE